MVCSWIQLSEAQSWRADWEGTGALSTEQWRHDVSHFVRSNGWLRLSAPEEYSHSLVSTSIMLPSGALEWRGGIAVTAKPSSRNYTYILLGVLSYSPSPKAYDFLALAIGGVAREGIALVRLGFDYLTNRPTLSTRPAQSLIHLPNYPKELYTGGVRFAVELNEGKLRLSLGSQQGQLISQGETLFTQAPLTTNSLGIYCAYTEGRRSGTRFMPLSIGAPGHTATEPSGPIPTDPTTTSPHAYPFLSEVMANPPLGTPEYLELYNPNDIPTKLSGLTLSIGSTLDKRKALHLKTPPTLEPKTCLVLTSDAKALQAQYTKAESSQIHQIALPRLANAGSYIYLMDGSLVIDSVHYTPGLHAQRLRNKRGVALVRIGWEAGESESLSWVSASESEGYASPTWITLTATSGSTQGDTNEGEYILLSQLIAQLEASPNLTPTITCYSTDALKIWALDGSVAREWLLALYNEPASALKLFPSPIRQVRILSISLSDKVYAYKMLY